MTPQELKASILQLAIQGKLVEQRHEEGVGEELYKQIQAEKQELIKLKKIKKDKPLPEITEDEIPFDIPNTWKWVRIQDLFNVKSAMRIHQTDWKTNGIPFFRGRELVQLVNTGNVDFDIYISRELYEANKAKGGVPQKDDLLISAVGTLGKVYVVKGTKEFYYKDAYILCLENIGKMFPHYIKFALESPYSQAEIRRDSMATTVAQLTIIKAKGLLIPLPPVEEQKRIVAKLQEILPSIDHYEQAWSKLKEFNKKFPVDMQKSVLQMAIQGKLVEQRPEEGTGEELFNQIQAEKQELIKSGKIKKEKLLPEITEEIPFDVPETWKWVRWGEIVNIVSARRVHQSDWKKEGIPFYRAREIAKLAIDGCVENDLFISQELYDEFSKSGVPKTGDLMVTAVGTLGKTYIVKDTDRFYYKDASVICFENFAQVCPEYLKYMMESELMRSQIRSNSSGTTVATLTMVSMVEYLMPLPPLAEQKRIVQKLEEILPLCERLK